MGHGNQLAGINFLDLAYGVAPVRSLPAENAVTLSHPGRTIARSFLERPRKYSMRPSSTDPANEDQGMLSTGRTFGDDLTEEQRVAVREFLKCL